MQLYVIVETAINGLDDMANLRRSLPALTDAFRNLAAAGRESIRPLTTVQAPPSTAIFPSC